MTNFSFPAIRYASDMPFAVGMVLASEDGGTVEVLAASPRFLALTGGGFEAVSFVRSAYPHLVFVTEMVADAEAREVEREEAENERDWLERQEMLRVGALAQWAQHEDDLKEQVLARAAAEWSRKNP